MCIRDSTLMALRHAKDQKARVLAICNANGSTIPRESDAVLYTHAGPEIAVASTKGFLTQLVACYLVGLFLAQVRGIKYEDEVATVVSNIQEVRARGARTIVIAEEGDEDVVPYADHVIRVPRTPTLLAPVVTTVPLQVLACEIADSRGLDVDQPRNLAKSVTVE